MSPAEAMYPFSLDNVALQPRPPEPLSQQYVSFRASRSKDKVFGRMYEPLSGSHQHQAQAAPATEFMVGRSADEVLDRAQTYFARRWPHTGEVNRLRASVEFSANTKVRYGRLFMELFKVVTLSLLTAGIYLLYWLLFRRSRLANHHRAEVFARNQEDGTLVRVNAGTVEYQTRLQTWVVTELGGQPMLH